MGPLATLTLFPPHSLDTSILAAVLIGVILLALLTESFGWVFVGLVVPGYLASVFVIHPEAAITVTVEAVLTYLLAQLLSRGLSATGAWSEFFGRERFFLIVICSVLVRAISEVVFLPRMGAWMDVQLGTSFMLDRSLHSVGLVLVPLTANAFWKIGLRRGVLQVGLPVALTWALLTFVLLPYTNLSFSSLELTYEDVAQRFLASPKAYIILLTTAFLAARYNHRYGWDFNGILIAALVALTWLGPLKTVATVAEVLILVAGGKLLLSLPGIRTMNLEGPRKTVLLFVLGFLLKFAIGWIVGGRIPGLKATDLFGFGYLVPTLLAVKILQKQAIARVLLPTLHTSLAGVVVGSLIGFPLSLLEPRQAVAAEEDVIANASLGLDRTPVGVMALARATCREHDARWAPIRRRRGELREYESLWRAADEWLTTRSSDALSGLREHARSLDLELRRLERPEGEPETFALIERYGQGGLTGWGTALLIPGEPGPILEVPRPASEAPTAEAAALLCAQVRCRAVLVSGMDTRLAGLDRGDALAESNTPFQSAHGVLTERARVQLRADAAATRGQPTLHVAPGAESTARAMWPDVQVTTSAPPEPGMNFGEPGVSIFRAHPDDLIALVAQMAPPAGEPTTMGALFAEANGTQDALRPASRTLAAAELIVIEQQIAAPLLETAPSVPLPLRLGWSRAMAQLVGLEVREVQGCGGDEGCWLITEPAARAHGAIGASMLVREGGAPLALEVPASSREAGALPLGLELFKKTSARAIAFTDPLMDPSTGVAGAATPGTVNTAFQAFHQAMGRTLPSTDGFILQLRGFSSRTGVDADALVVLDGPVLRDDQRPKAIERLWNGDDAPLAWLNGRVRYHDGAPELAGLTSPSPQLAFMRAFGGPSFASLWFSGSVRGAFLAPRDIAEELAVTRAVTEAPTSKDPVDALRTGLSAPGRPASRALEQRFDKLMSSARRYVAQRSIHELRGLLKPNGRASTASKVEVLYSPEHGLPYVLVEAREGRQVLRGMHFLQREVDGGGMQKMVAGETLQHAVADALRRRAPMVVAGEVVEGGKR